MKVDGRRMSDHVKKHADEGALDFSAETVLVSPRSEEMTLGHTPQHQGRVHVYLGALIDPQDCILRTLIA